MAGLAILFLIWLFSGSSGSRTKQSSSERVISGKPPVVIVTVFDEKSGNAEAIKNLKENRIQYAKKHGYGTHFASADDYNLKGAPSSWSKVPALRHAMTQNPNCKYLWYLDQNALIMEPNLKVEDYMMKPSKLEASMIRDLPVVPPDSIIKTFSHLKAEDVEFVLTQDKDGLSTGSFIIQNGEWAKFFLDTWFGPLYRSYNFQKAETHALEHIVQWHPTILSKLAIIPQRMMNSYSSSKRGEEYKDGDIVVRFAGCTTGQGELNCAQEVKRYESKWRQAFAKA